MSAKFGPESDKAEANSTRKFRAGFDLTLPDFGSGPISIRAEFGHDRPDADQIWATPIQWNSDHPWRNARLHHTPLRVLFAALAPQKMRARFPDQRRRRMASQRSRCLGADPRTARSTDASLRSLLSCPSDMATLRFCTALGGSSFKDVDETCVANGGRNFEAVSPPLVAKSWRVVTNGVCSSMCRIVAIRRTAWPITWCRVMAAKSGRTAPYS